DIARQNLAATPPPVAKRVPGVEADPGLERIALRLMEKQPQHRYQSGHEVVAALRLLEEERATAESRSVERQPEQPTESKSGTPRKPTLQPESEPELTSVPLPTASVSSSPRSFARMVAIALAALAAFAAVALVLTGGGEAQPRTETANKSTAAVTSPAPQK